MLDRFGAGPHQQGKWQSFWEQGNGFEIYTKDAAGICKAAWPIRNVELISEPSSDDSEKTGVRIHFSEMTLPANHTLCVAYAVHQSAPKDESAGGTNQGRYGLLCDSDAITQPNYLVHLELEVALQKNRSGQN